VKYFCSVQGEVGTNESIKCSTDYQKYIQLGNILISKFRSEG